MQTPVLALVGLLISLLVCSCARQQTKAVAESHKTSFLIDTFMTSAGPSIVGYVEDEFGEPVIGGTVALFKGSNLITGTTTDFDGLFSIPCAPGEYTLDLRTIGYDPFRTQELSVRAGRGYDIQYTLSGFYGPVDLGCFFGYRIPIINDGHSTEAIYSAQDIMRF